MPVLSISFDNKKCRIDNVPPGEFVQYSLRIHAVRDFRRSPEKDITSRDVFMERIPNVEFNIEDKILGTDGIYEIQLLQGNRIIDSRIGYIGRRGSGSIEKVDFSVTSTVIDNRFKISVKSNVCMNIDEMKDIYLLRDGEEIPIPPMHSIKDRKFNYGISFLVPKNHGYSICLNQKLMEFDCYQQKKVRIN